MVGGGCRVAVVLKACLVLALVQFDQDLSFGFGLGPSRTIIPLRGPSCKLGFARISAGLQFQDEQSVAKSINH